MLLNENPFFVLGASTRDSRQRIVELAEEKSLHLDQAICSRCSAELINPRQRLAAEVAWLPGCSHSQAVELVGSAIKWQGGQLPLLPSPLATANLHVTALAFGPASGSHLKHCLLDLARICERIEAGEVRALVNEDRIAAGFGQIESDTEVQRAVESRFVAYRTVLTGILRRLAEPQLTETLTEALEQGTARGTIHGPALLHSLTDALSVELQTQLGIKRAAVESAMEKVRAAGASQEQDVLERALWRLEGAIRQWDWFAQPLQLSAQARGQEHETSRELASSIRGLAIQLHNEYGQTGAAQKISQMIHESFVELPRMTEVVRSDIEQLEALIGHPAEPRREQAEEQPEPPPVPRPLVGSVCGIGTMLYGRRDADPKDGSYVATLYATILFIPILPLSAYRVIRSRHGRYKYLAVAESSSTATWHFGLTVAAGFFLLVRALAPTTPDYMRRDELSTPPSTSPVAGILADEDPFAGILPVEGGSPQDKKVAHLARPEAGLYRGTVTNTGLPGSPGSLDLEVSGEDGGRSGYLRIGPPLGGSGPFLSQSSSDSLRLLSLSASGDTIAWVAKLHGEAYGGKYFVVGGPFQGQSGVWKVAHKSGVVIAPGRSQRLSFGLAALLNGGIRRINSCVAIPTPTSGTELRTAPRDGLGRLSITNGTSNDAYAVLVDVSTNRPFRAIVVRAGDEAIFTKVRAGRYHLRFLLGTGWTKGSRHFCEPASASQFQRVMEFEETQRDDGIEYSTFKVSLHAVPGGTATTQFIDPDSID